jgi:para-aminobenzoate synthetase/4-amino-4-deoxychorismate lyase
MSKTYTDFPAYYYRLLDSRDNVVLLETSRYDAVDHYSYLFLDPVEILSIDRVNEVGTLLQGIQQATRAGYYAAGYLGYECGAYFEERVRALRDAAPTGQEEPLAWFGVYRAPLIFDHVTGQLGGSSSLPIVPARAATSAATLVDKDIVGGFHFEWSYGAYEERIARIKDYLRAGDVYQINFTGRLSFDFDGSPLALYQALKQKQPVAYGAYLHMNGHHVLSFSPELFFRITGNRIVTKPMKGTARRGCTLAEDDAVAAWLRADAKNRAENVMIVDLLRNDLGRICRVGSVRVPELFSIERYASVFQMTSTVEGIIECPPDFSSLFHSLFPSGSVTGAPKVRAMQLIQELERSPRSVYTGAIGFCAPTANFALTEQAVDSPTRCIKNAPNCRAAFNVAIRTILLRDSRGEMGIGSGIVHDSVAADEYAECHLKARFLTEPREEFSLLETILWQRGYRRLGKHLQRLEDSATYFGYPFERGRIQKELRQLVKACTPGERYRVRLTLARTGALACVCTHIEEQPTRCRARIALWSERTNSRDRFLYHKTTNRAKYDEAYQWATQAGYADVVFLNERNEVTEGAISNVFVRRGNCWLTPPTSSGLLNGIYRQHVLQTSANAREAVLTLQDMLEAKEIAICNAIKGWRPVTLSREFG